MNVRRIAVVMALAGLTACAGDTTGTDTLNVTGTWTGNLTLLSATESNTFNANLILTQSGTAVTGSAGEAGNTTDPRDAVTGSLNGSTLTITGTSPAPCNAYHWTVTFNATGSALVASGASGQICDSSGGAIASLHTLTTASGTLHK